MLATSLVSILLPGSHSFASERLNDFETWHSAVWKYYKRDKLTLSLSGEVRFNDDSTFNSFRGAKQHFGYAATSWLNLGFNIAYLEFASESAGTLNTWRLEWEVTPFFKSERGLTVSFRNRLELFFNEDADTERWRWRVRVRFDQNLDGFWASRASLSNEFFYDFAPDDFNQNRLIPLALTFPLNANVSYTPYLLIQSTLRQDNFVHDFVLGHTLSF
ncbi:MAG: DUF2490 domain-containing protein [Opitutales bacterium]